MVQKYFLSLSCCVLCHSTLPWLSHHPFAAHMRELTCWVDWVRNMQTEALFSWNFSHHSALVHKPISFAADFWYLPSSAVLTKRLLPSMLPPNLPPHHLSCWLLLLLLFSCVLEIRENQNWGRWYICKVRWHVKLRYLYNMGNWTGWRKSCIKQIILFDTSNVYSRTLFQIFISNKVEKFGYRASSI